MNMMYSLLVHSCLSYELCCMRLWIESKANQICAFTTFWQHSNEHAHKYKQKLTHTANTVNTQVAYVGALKLSRRDVKWIPRFVEYRFTIQLKTKLDKIKWDSQIHQKPILCIRLPSFIVTKIFRMCMERWTSRYGNCML